MSDVCLSVVCPDVQGETALHTACQHDLARLVTKLLECGANPNLQTLPPESFGLETDDARVYRQSPLHLAIRANNINTVKAFLEHKGKLSIILKATVSFNIL